MSLPGLVNNILIKTPSKSNTYSAVCPASCEHLNVGLVNNKIN